MYKIKNWPIRTKLRFFFLAVGVTGLINCLGVVHYLAVQKDDAALIDLAGRNRMLTQRIAFYAGLLAKGRPVQEELKISIELLNSSLNVLKEGGPPLENVSDRELPATPDHLLPTLLEAEQLWRSYKENTELLLREPAYEKGGEVAVDSVRESARSRVGQPIDFVETNAGALLAKFDQLVKQYVHESEKKQGRLAIFLWLLFFVLTVIVLVGIWTVKESIIQPLAHLKTASDELALGKLVSRPELSTNDEIGSVFKSMTLLVRNMENASLFAQQIAKGDFISDYTPASEHDSLGQSLIYMRDKLKEVAIEDKKRNWASEGLAKFSEILRDDRGDLPEVSNNVLSSLVKYMGANQGGVFVVNDEDSSNPFLELLAMFAWERRRFLKKRFEPGEGLAGQAWLEKEMIYLKEVPSNYVEITSGLGKATPRSVVVVPLKLNEEIFGILELASFKEYEKFELDFLQKLSETIASTLSSAKINQRTKRLLEQSQLQTEGLRAQEEELRQNMEEIQATQEEMRRKTTETESRLLAIDESGVASIEFNLDGTIVTANQNFLRLMEYDLTEIQGKHHRIFVDPSYAATVQYKQFWEDLGNGIPRPGEYERKTKSGKKIIIQGSYSIIRDPAGRPVRILKLAMDVTRLHEAQANIRIKELDIESRLSALEGSGVASVEFDMDGTILNANENFLALMEYSLSEIRGRHHRIFVDPAEAESTGYRVFWENLRKGISQPGNFVRITKSGKRIAIRGSYSVMRDQMGNPSRILKLATVQLTQGNEDKSRLP